MKSKGAFKTIGLIIIINFITACSTKNKVALDKFKGRMEKKRDL